MQMDKHMQLLSKKVANNERLTKEDGLYLYECNDLISIGKLARDVKQKKTGRNVFFNVNRHINLTNICVSKCEFCAFGKDKDEEGAYLMSVEEAFNFGAEVVENGITEFHVVSAMHPDMPFNYYVDVIKRLHQAYPNIHMQAFTAVEIHHFSKITGLSIRDVLLQLKDAGLGSIPGGGAEIFNDDIRKQICPKKAMSNDWLEVHKTAHELGIKSNCTMLFGHIESFEDRINHLIKLRELQDEAPGFQSFIPLPFLPDNTGLTHIKRTTAIDDVKTIAISRLMLDNIEHVKAFWVMLSVPIAQLCLEFGADDIDGTVHEERIMHAAGATTDKGISKDNIIRLIKEAGYLPTERDTLYNVLRTY
ncbi:Aminodeoxyfutalosine synthase [Candidatus Syntrophocurvum alkaliphilum]|uniref:Aminodeoxyfutalosine synthase n=1 Tax=Candidatus Syntrophocurvum alkaliphilum TaxID=2293317 RepID=A0A6I6DIF3_9FIRM|nr:aminofutalosine synthase MqnE [Candidatus Syntrophocurvum alkaliphilum]QGT99311.1 Aminodeoxyfutalosine synthase [Candidatus Syntrophocurvum alkaliphilum]